MTTLGAYLKNNEIRQDEFAARLGVTQATVSRLCRGDSLPSLRLAAAIKQATDNVVDLESWIKPPGAPQ
ncbi:helix-turn-helix transcriptional regulator [Paracoccus yeei]|uniref:helix-turn-helix transcriptional regulator n=1 Tax=Paracoccus yeei TaxID=147645 RepID=UPI001C8EFCED|nr:helix-turn-helix transcriptional regulator [Paracoccus yeei]MBY0137511.1 helix-turn-helix transcriptional regulator [Paracoccus yeei]